jgi:hypothetical protein
MLTDANTRPQEQQRASGKRAQKRAAKEAAAAAASTSAAQPATSAEVGTVDYDDDFAGLAESGEDAL